MDKTQIEKGHGPLHYAAGSGDLSIVKYLVEEAKIDIKAVDKSGNTPLEVADDGAVKDYLQALSLFQAVKNESLLDAKALIPQLSLHFIEKEQDEHGNTLPHLACENGDLEMLQLLLDAKASINARRKDGKTSLLIACGRGHVQIVKRLVELKAEMKAGDTNGYFLKASEDK